MTAWSRLLRQGLSPGQSESHQGSSPPRLWGWSWEGQHPRGQRATLICALAGRPGDPAQPLHGVHSAGLLAPASSWLISRADIVLSRARHNPVCGTSIPCSASLPTVPGPQAPQRRPAPSPWLEQTQSGACTTDRPMGLHPWAPLLRPGRDQAQRRGAGQGHSAALLLL